MVAKLYLTQTLTHSFLNILRVAFHLHSFEGVIDSFEGGIDSIEGGIDSFEGGIDSIEAGIAEAISSFK